MNHEHARPGRSDRQDGHGRYETHEAPITAENSSDEPGGTTGSAAGPDAEERTAGGPDGPPPTTPPNHLPRPALRAVTSGPATSPRPPAPEQASLRRRGPTPTG